MNVTQKYFLRLKNILANAGQNQNTWWIGATDLHHEGSFIWMSGAPWSYEHWNQVCVVTRDT